MNHRFTPSSEQRDIISYEPQSLRVAAGAGTGKTTTIVHRIQHLVGAGVDPTRIVGVTFTNKAAAELHQRVIDSLHIEDTDRIPHIATYHGFASSILDEFGALVGYDRSSRLMDDGHRSELANRVLRRVTSPDLDLTSIPSRKTEMLSLAASLTDNLLTPATVRAAAPMHRPNPESGDHEAIMAVWATRIGLLEAVEQYEAEKLALGLIEYSDLIRLAIDIVESSPDIATEIASRYEAVVLDEYQDTDPAQRKLLTTLFAGSVPVVAVGDTDQTIYEWRGASAENFAGFPRDFPRTSGKPAETLPLSENRRSDRLIIDLANRVREELPHVTGARPLRATSKANAGEVVVSWFNSDLSEAAWIAESMTRANQQGVRWNEMAVLCRVRSQFEPIVEAMSADGIPFTVASMGGLPEVPEIADLLAWLEVLEDATRETSLLRIWFGGQFRLGMSDVGVLRRWSRDHRDAGLFGAALNLSEVVDLSPVAAERLHAFVALHEGLASRSQVQSVAATIDDLINTLDVWAEVAALDSGPSLTARLNIGRLMSLAEGWRPIDGRPTLGRFLSYLNALDESGRSEELAVAMPVHSDAVSVMTMHAAKGLEWSHVYLPAVASKVFPGSTRVHDDPDRHGYLLPYQLRLDADNHSNAARTTGKERTAILRARQLSQEWRLAYVATTRAATRLSISGHAWDDGIKRPRAPSALWEMADALPGSLEGPREAISDSPPAYAGYTPRVEPTDPLFREGPQAALRRTITDPTWIERDHPELSGAVSEQIQQLELAISNLSSPTLKERTLPFSTSVTNLVALAGCAQKFKWIHHDRLPQRPRASAAIGTAFHRRVELHNLGVIAFDDPGAAEYDAGGPAEEPPSKAADPWALFESSRFAEASPIHVEEAFELAVPEGTVRGKVDAIYEPEPGTWEIVDYKSGRHRDDPARTVQLEAYAIAAAEGAISATIPESMIVTFAYFGGSELEETSEVVDVEWLDGARTHVEALVSQGSSGPFDPSPSADCRWCDFLHICPAGQATIPTPQMT